MKFVLTGAKIYRKGRFEESELLIDDGLIADISPKVFRCDNITVVSCNNCIIVPGFVDVHVHLREPGFLYKETIETGTAAASHGGFTHICPMPNLNPVPDSIENLDIELEQIKKSALIGVHTYGAITVGEKGEVLSDMESMKNYVVAFSDDGRGVQNKEMMRSAMLTAKPLGKIIAAHCEVNELLDGGYIHDGKYAKNHGHKGICSRSEYEQIQRDVRLSEETGEGYHVCHISCKESVDIIRKAKSRGVNVTCETAPHYLVLSDKDLKEDGRFKMNPPLRDEEDRLALLEGIVDGTIDMIATDHAPHSAEEKSKGLEKSLMGVVGLETSFAVMYTKLVKKGLISLEKLLQLMHDNPKERFKIGGEIQKSQKADLAVISLADEWTVNPSEFLSMGRATPFEGEKLFGKTRLTMYNGNIVYNDGSVKL